MLYPWAVPELSASLPLEPTEGPDAAVGSVFSAAWHPGSVMTCLSLGMGTFIVLGGVGLKGK